MKGLAILFLTLFSISLYAQQFPCAQIIQKAFNAKNIGSTRGNEIIIPVVFHIVYRNDDQNISDALIHDQLETLNADFNLKNEDITSIPNQSMGNLGNVGLRFKIAEIGPDGNLTNGIIRSQTDEDRIGNQIDSDGRSWIKQAEFGGSNPWSTQEYINIWIGDRSLSLGSTFSKNSSGSDIIGIILDYQTLSPKSRTLTHEMGHFFGLLHPWGNNTGCDDEDDEIADTPFQAYPDFSCSPVSECGITSKVGNFMDFNVDACLLYFTKGQALNMQQFIINFMPGFLETGDCFIGNLPDSGARYSYNQSYRGIEIYFSESIDLLGIELYSMEGKSVLKGLSKSENYINISTEGISSGIYLLQFIEHDKLTAHKIFIY